MNSPGMNQAMIAEKAVSNRSILIFVYTVTIQQSQQKMPPYNMGLNLQAAPVMKVGIPYNSRKKGDTNSLNRKAAL
jgi:hypothetical protein